MKIRRFAGSDMRDAMRQVREALGADAVILETTRLATGVEISAAVDADGADPGAAASMSRAAGSRPAGIDAYAFDAEASGPAVRIGTETAASTGWYQPPRKPNAADGCSGTNRPGSPRPPPRCCATT
ncbi:MAG: hypothetical protein DYH20_12105 [Gammaproteobacteria bacterium PRO9]|nr:hypothetical protein [Gammaproteobacteria bacterium PRO9]